MERPRPDNFREPAPPLTGLRTLLEKAGLGDRYPEAAKCYAELRVKKMGIEMGLSGVQVRHADSPPELFSSTRVRVRAPSAPAVEVKLKVPELAAATASSAHLDADPSAHLASHLDELRMELSSQRAHIESMRAQLHAIESMRAQLHAVETREATSSAQIKELRKELGSRNRIMKYVMRRSAASESHADESELAHMYVGSGTEPSKS
jgi:hypothetical protein